MSAAQFFLLMLLLPVIVGVGAHPFWADSLPAIAIRLGGLPYLVVAAIACVPIYKSKSLGRLAAITLLMPIAFAIPFVALSGPFAIILVLLVSYGYVAIAWALYGVALASGRIVQVPPNTSLERTREG